MGVCPVLSPFPGPSRAGLHEQDEGNDLCLLWGNAVPLIPGLEEIKPGRGEDRLGRLHKALRASDEKLPEMDRVPEDGSVPVPWGLGQALRRNQVEEKEKG